MDVDVLVNRWSRSPGELLRPARPSAELDVFASRVRQRFGIDPPADYRRFLTLADGGQRDHVVLYGIGSEDSVLDRCQDMHTGGVLVIGSSGNLDAYALRDDGRAEIVNFFSLDEVHETFPSFTELLQRLLEKHGAK